MDTDREHAAVTRVRILLLALMGALVWVVLSVFGVSSPASADDGNSPESTVDAVAAAGSSLLGEVLAVVDAAPAEPATEPAPQPAPDSQSSPEQLAAAPVVAETVSHITDATTDVLALVPGTVDAIAPDPVTDAVAELTGWVPGLKLPGIELTTAPTNAPASVLTSAPMTVRSSLSGFGHVGGVVADASSVSVDDALTVGGIAAPTREPVAPTSPDSLDVGPPAPTASSQLVAALPSSDSTVPPTSVLARAGDDTLPTAATFDTDCSPD